MVPVHITGTVPKRSASAPENGCPRPHRMFWIAMAKANRSRPQPFNDSIGVMKKPRVERGPNAVTAARQPQMRMTAGVRQVMEDADEFGTVMRTPKQDARPAFRRSAD